MYKLVNFSDLLVLLFFDHGADFMDVTVWRFFFELCMNVFIFVFICMSNWNWQDVHLPYYPRTDAE